MKRPLVLLTVLPLFLGCVTEKPRDGGLSPALPSEQSSTVPADASGAPAALGVHFLYEDDGARPTRWIRARSDVNSRELVLHQGMPTDQVFPGGETQIELFARFSWDTLNRRRSDNTLGQLDAVVLLRRFGPPHRDASGWAEITQSLPALPPLPLDPGGAAHADTQLVLEGANRERIPLQEAGDRVTFPAGIPGGPPRAWLVRLADLSRLLRLGPVTLSWGGSKTTLTVEFVDEFLWSLDRNLSVDPDRPVVPFSSPSR
jgi:hypothetical protein